MHVYFFLPSSNKIYLLNYLGTSADPGYAIIGAVPTTSPLVPPNNTAWNSLIANPAVRIASDVVEFGVVSSSPTYIQFPLTMNIQLQRTGPSGETISYSTVRSLFPSNSQ
jgi:hypothetical protein